MSQWWWLPSALFWNPIYAQHLYIFIYEFRMSQHSTLRGSSFIFLLGGGIFFFVTFKAFLLLKIIQNTINRFSGDVDSGPRNSKVFGDVLDSGGTLTFDHPKVISILCYKKRKNKLFFRTWQSLLADPIFKHQFKCCCFFFCFVLFYLLCCEHSN